MPTDTKQILESILALPATDRAMIVKSILAGLDHPDARIDEIWAEEAEKRVAAFDAGQMKAIPADEVLAEGPAAALSLRAEYPPLRVAEGGVVRVGKSRISLDLVVDQYENGMAPEDMVRAYDTLVLADVHAVIAYYLRHPDEVRAYLKRREEEAEALRAKIEVERPRVSRNELLARRSAREKAIAPTGPPEKC
jgi:putative addiction module component (TIGR02574 family)